MSSINEQVGLRLKIARKTAGYKTAIDFAQASGIAKSTYAQHEKGSRSLNAEQLMDYADKLKVNPGWLLTGNGHPCPLCEDKQVRKAKIDKEITILQENGKLPTIAYPLIAEEDDSALINMKLFSEILSQTIGEVFSRQFPIQANDLIGFCIEIYNSVAFLQDNNKDREKIVQLSVHSMLLGSKVMNKGVNKHSR